MTPTLKINSWTPRFHPKSKEGNGDYTSYFYETHALVKVFAFVGDDRTGEFTVLDAYYNNRCHQAWLPKYYHPRWHSRLARQFDWQIAAVKSV